MMLVRGMGALLIILMWGDLAQRRIGGRYPVAASPAGRIGLTWLWGGGLVSWGLFVCLWAGLSLPAAVTLVSLLGGLLWLVMGAKATLVEARDWYKKSVQRVRSRPRLQRCPRLNWGVVFGLIILIQTALVALAAAASPLTDWDAWVNWASKANAIFIDQTLSPNLYNNPARLPTNMDYPLMLPLLETWFFTWLGRIHEPAIGLISLLFYLTLLLLFYHAARRLVATEAALGFTALLATVPRLERLGHNGLADVPLATLVLSAFLLLFSEYNKRLDQEKWLPGAALGFSAGLLPWLKNEGWLWLLLVSLTWLVGLWQRTRQKKLPAGQAGSLIIVYGGVVLMIAGAWPFFLGLKGTYHFAFLPLTAGTLVANGGRIPEIAAAMLVRLLNPYWNFIWLFMAVTVLVRRQKSWSGPAGWLLLPITGYLVLAGMTYIFSRFNPYLAHLNNSAERLILQAVPLALWWLAGQCVALGWVRGESGA